MLRQLGSSFSVVYSKTRGALRSPPRITQPPLVEEALPRPQSQGNPMQTPTIQSDRVSKLPPPPPPVDPQKQIQLTLYDHEAQRNRAPLDTFTKEPSVH